MNFLRRIMAVFAFEWRRALTFPRLAWMAALTTIPPVLATMIRMAARQPPPYELSVILIYVLCVCVACMLSVFLWATPAISTELEGRSWVYLAVRPWGPSAVLLGKYLVAVSWSIPVGLLASALSIFALGISEPWRIIATEWGLVVLSCLSYSAVFLAIGVLAPKRAMVVGVIYAVIFEFALASVPAAVNLVTVQYRLRCLLVRWAELDTVQARGNAVFSAYFGDEGAAWHVALLFVLVAFYLTAAGGLLHFREFTAASETDT